MKFEFVETVQFFKKKFIISVRIKLINRYSTQLLIEMSVGRLWSSGRCFFVAHVRRLTIHRLEAMRVLPQKPDFLVVAVANRSKDQSC